MINAADCPPKPSTAAAIDQSQLSRQRQGSCVVLHIDWSVVPSFLTFQNKKCSVFVNTLANRAIMKKYLQSN